MLNFAVPKRLSLLPSLARLTNVEESYINGSYCAVQQTKLSMLAGDDGSEPKATVIDSMQSSASASIGQENGLHVQDSKGEGIKLFYCLNCPCCRSRERLRQGQRSSREEMSQARSQRIHEGGHAYGDRVRGDGICRVFRKIDFHSHQQHHRRLFLSPTR
ncbi:hypothetical protein ACH5RR_036901 [Cinchona calisaya]|uniref:Uncharacterized protein n=1 Tax=Cinchona calisaya TaxID=153742 RepID=A0ABD2Y4J2_9GENT